MKISFVRIMITLFFMSALLLSFSALQAQTQDMIIDTNGNVGIGTPSPEQKLHIEVTDTNSASNVDVLVLEHELVSGASAVGFGTGLLFRGTSGGGSITNYNQARIRTVTNSAGNNNAHGLSFEVKPNGGTALTEAMRINNGGNVGIGTTNPSAKLTLAGGNLLIDANEGSIILDSTGADLSIGATQIGTMTANDFYLRSNGADRITIAANGNVGIGTTIAPQALLHVAGNIQVDGNINAKYQDLAEYVRTSESLTKGMVVMIDTKEVNQVVPSDRAYNTLVAGVVSETPGIILGEGGADKAIIAHTGRVKVKVNTSSGEISAGDLLVTSPVKGFAMKADTDKLKPGMLLGKALEPLKEGQLGEILVLITLQ